MDSKSRLIFGAGFVFRLLAIGILFGCFLSPLCQAETAKPGTDPAKADTQGVRSQVQGISSSGSAMERQLEDVSARVAALSGRLAMVSALWVISFVALGVLIWLQKKGFYKSTNGLWDTVSHLKTVSSNLAVNLRDCQDSLQRQKETLSLIPIREEGFSSQMQPIEGVRQESQFAATEESVAVRKSLEQIAQLVKSQHDLAYDVSEGLRNIATETREWRKTLDRAVAILDRWQEKTAGRGLNEEQDTRKEDSSLTPTQERICRDDGQRALDEEPSAYSGTQALEGPVVEALRSLETLETLATQRRIVFDLAYIKTKVLQQQAIGDYDRSRVAGLISDLYRELNLDGDSQGIGNLEAIAGLWSLELSVPRVGYASLEGMERQYLSRLSDQKIKEFAIRNRDELTSNLVAMQSGSTVLHVIEPRITLHSSAGADLLRILRPGRVVVGD